MGNNLYLQADPYTPAVPVTTSGQHNVIYNGLPDWLYEGNYLYCDTSINVVILQSHDMFVEHTGKGANVT